MNIKKAIDEIKRYKHDDYLCTISDETCNIAIFSLKKQIPLKLEYKNGFANCTCGCEFESEGYQGEEFCPECGQKVWVGDYNGEVNSNVIEF